MSDNKTPDLRQELSSGPQEQNIPEEHSKKADINYMNAMQSMFRAMNQVPGAMPQEEHTTQEEPTQAYSAPQAKPPVPEAVAPQVSAEQPVQPTPAAQAPKAPAPAAGTPAAQAPFAQAPYAQAPATDAPAAQAPFAQAPATDAPTAQAPFAQAPATDAPAAQAPFAQAPATDAPAAQAPFAQGGYFTGKAEPVADTAPFHTLSSEQAERASAQPATPSAVPEPSAEEFAGDREDESYWSYVDSILDHFDEEKKGQATGRPKSETFPRQQSAARTAVAPQPAPETPSAPANPDWAQAGTPAERAYAARQTRIHRSREAYERQNPVSRQPSSAVEQPMQAAWQDQAATQQTVEFPPQQPQEDAFLPEKKEKKKKPVKKKAEDVQPSRKGKKTKKGKKGKKKKGGNILPKKGDSAFEIVRKLVVIISAIALLGCAIYFGYTFKERYDNRNVNKDAQALANQDYSDEEVAAKWKEIKAKYPDVDFPEGMQVKFASLYAQNQDLVGWIKIEGLGINYPVMQNGDYYLKHNFSKAYSAYGAPYLDQYNKVNPLDDNTTIYAHSMRRDDQMFTNLKEYKTVDGFKKNPIIEYSTLYGNYKFKVYAVFITNGDASGDNGYLFNYPTSNFVSDEAFVGYLEQLNQRALYTTGVDVEIGDKLITLSTCTYDFTDARLVVVGRMVRKGEDAVVDTSQAVKNSNPRYPQAYYSAKGLSNPYKNAKKWYNQDA